MTPLNVIIKFKDRVYDDDIEFVESNGGIVKKKLPLISSVAVIIPEENIPTIQDDPYVEYIEEDKKRYILGFPSNPDEKYITQNLQSLAQTVPWGIIRIRAPEVHTLGNKGKNIRICVIDTGIDYKHEDLQLNYKGGYNFVDDIYDPFDDHGHGTHVSGTIAAVDNNVGFIGVAPDAYLYSLKTLDSSGSGLVSNCVLAITWAINNKMNIISMSYGSNEFSQSEKDACDAAYDAGILLVAAAGNNGGDGLSDNVIYPAKNDSVIAVSATDENNNRASFSSTGSSVELAAPGVSIGSTIPNNSYAHWNGTSMACPHVYGAAALILKKNPSLTNIQVRNILTSTTTHLGTVGRNWLYGYGLVDAKKAIDNTSTITCPLPSISCDFIVTGELIPNNTITFTAIDLTLTSYNWYKVSTYQGSEPSFTTTFDTAGTYTISLIATNLCGTDCSITKEINICPENIACTGNCPVAWGLKNGCEFLKYFDANKDGIISAQEFSQAQDLYDVGFITLEEYNFVLSAYNNGSINSICTNCYIAPFLNSITISGCTSSIVVGATCTLSATCTDQFDEAIACGTITWTSRDTAIATVNSSTGVVTGVSAGTARIYATASGVNSSDKLVTVTTVPCTTPTCNFTIVQINK